MELFVFLWDNFGQCFGNSFVDVRFLSLGYKTSLLHDHLTLNQPCFNQRSQLRCDVLMRTVKPFCQLRCRYGAFAVLQVL